MKRTLFPSVEALESKALLSHLGAGAMAEHHHPAQVRTHGNSRVASELTLSLTTNQSNYAVGQNVQMTLIATNDTRHNVAVWVGPNAGTFSITQGGQVVWRSNSGPQPLRPTMRRVLHPGESLTLTANWTATTTGTFVVHNRMAPRGPVATFSVEASQPTQPVNPPVASDLAISLTTDRSSYTVGESVQMNLTATNTTDHNVTVAVGPNTNVFSITRDGQLIWRSNSGPQPLYPTVAQVLVPGQSLTLRANWTATTTGTFLVSNDMAPQGPVATFSVTANQTLPPVNPPVGSQLAISLTTNQPSYTVGQVVQMSLTATNDSNHNVTVWVGPNTNVFSITRDGQVVWRSNSGPQPLYPTVRKVLRPGQSLTLTARWTATATGTFVVHNQLAPQGPVATFSVNASQPMSVA